MSIKKDGKIDVYSFVNNPWVILAFNIFSVVSAIASYLIGNKICTIIFCSMSSVFIFVVAFYIIYRAINLRKTKRNIEATNVATNKTQYENIHIFQHDLRNYTNYINKNSNMDFDNFRDKARVLCDTMQHIFSSVLQTKGNVSVCLKYIKTETILNTDYKNWEIRTLARSRSTDRSRFTYDDVGREPDLIADNTDFEVIVSDEKKFQGFNRFSCGDLDSYPDEFRKKYAHDFKNSHENPPYKSTIVIPIRISSEYLLPILEENISDRYSYHALGFLCIDSEDKFVQTPNGFEYNKFKNCEELACSFADSLYDFYEAFFIKEIINQLPSCIDKNVKEEMMK